MLKKLFYQKNTIIFSIIFIFLFSVQIARTEESPNLIKVFLDNQQQFTGVAITDSSRLFLCYPYWLDNHKYSVVEIMSDGTVKPYPDKTWNYWQKGMPAKDRFICVQALWADKQGFLWAVDPASPALSGGIPGGAKLVKINLKNNRVEKQYYFDSTVADKTSYINDVRIDEIKQYAYLSDSGNGAILILNLKTGKCRKVLVKQKSTLSDPSYKFIVNKKELSNAIGSVKINCDGIALSKDNKYLYYKPLTDNCLYRIETKNLLNSNLPSAMLNNCVQFVGKICPTDGMIFDEKGNLYMGDVENSSIVKYTPSSKKETLIQDKRLIWPDSYAISKSGYLFVTCSQIQMMPWFNKGVDLRKTPYMLYKIKL